MAPRTSGRPPIRRELKYGLFFVSPSIVFFLALWIAPVLLALYYSLTNWKIGPSAGFVGLKNYADLLTDPRFRQSALASAELTALAVVATVVLALGLAVLLNDDQLLGNRLFKVLVIAPVVTDWVATGLVWQLVFLPNRGVLAGLFSLVGLRGLMGLGWTSTSTLAPVAIALFIIWKTTGLYASIFLAGLKGIPKHYAEAALVDGANGLQVFRRITLPLLRPITVFVVVTAFVTTIGLFEPVFMLTGGGPVDATRVTHIFTESDTYRDDVIDAAHQARQRWIGGIACFSDHAHKHRLLDQRPELWPIDAHGIRRPPMEWYVGVTPTFEDYSATRQALAEQLVREHALDGFMLDFIRWPIHWELELRFGARRAPESSFDAHTLARFQTETGVELPADLPGTAAQATWIRTHAAAEWVGFKCHVITQFVRECSHRVRTVGPVGLPFGVYTLPLPPDELRSTAGQDLADIAPLVDWVAPMAYHAILHRPPAWVAEMIDYTNRAAPGRVLPVVQIDSSGGSASGADWGSPVSPGEASAVVRSATSAETLGAVVFPGLALLSADG